VVVVVDSVYSVLITAYLSLRVTVFSASLLRVWNNLCVNTVSVESLSSVLLTVVYVSVIGHAT